MRHNGRDNARSGLECQTCEQSSESRVRKRGRYMERRLEVCWDKNWSSEFVGRGRRQMVEWDRWENWNLTGEGGCGE